MHSSLGNESETLSQKKKKKKERKEAKEEKEKKGRKEKRKEKEEKQRERKREERRKKKERGEREEKTHWELNLGADAFFHRLFLEQTIYFFPRVCPLCVGTNGSKEDLSLFCGSL